MRRTLPLVDRHVHVTFVLRGKDAVGLGEDRHGALMSKSSPILEKVRRSS
jgi:hypothetical protein